MILPAVDLHLLSGIEAPIHERRMGAGCHLSQKKTSPKKTRLRRMVSTDRKLQGLPPLGRWPRWVSHLAMAREPWRLLTHLRTIPPWCDSG